MASVLRDTDTPSGCPATESDSSQVPVQDQLASPNSQRSGNQASVDCAICLDSAVFPVELPCSHAFCYLCLKGTALLATQQGRSPRCSMCRSNIPLHVLTNPPLKDNSSLQKESQPSNEYQWYYECRSGGWWQFEGRQKVELERAFEDKEPLCKLLIAGQVFEVDLQQMIQYRPTSRHIIRRIKRDLGSSDKKGIAGIRINSTSSTPSSAQSPGGDNRLHEGSPTTTTSATALLAPITLQALATGQLTPAPGTDPEFWVDEDEDSYDEDEQDDDDDPNTEDEYDLGSASEHTVEDGSDLESNPVPVLPPNLTWLQVRSDFNMDQVTAYDYLPIRTISEPSFPGSRLGSRTISEPPPPESLQWQEIVVDGMFPAGDGNSEPVRRLITARRLNLIGAGGSPMSLILYEPLTREQQQPPTAQSNNVTNNVTGIPEVVRNLENNTEETMDVD